MELVPIDIDCNKSDIQLHCKITTLPTDIALSLMHDRRLGGYTNDLLAQNTKDLLARNIKNLLAHNIKNLVARNTKDILACNARGILPYKAEEYI